MTSSLQPLLTHSAPDQLSPRTRVTVHCCFRLLGQFILCTMVRGHSVHSDASMPYERFYMQLCKVQLYIDKICARDRNRLTGT